MHYPDFPFKRIHLKETNSTSSYLRTLCNTQATEEFTVISTDFQTAGRGQRGNSWESEEKKTCYSAYCWLRLSYQPRTVYLIPGCIFKHKEELDTYGSGFSIKWPNDIYWNDKKICGILIENDLQGSYLSQSIAGIGININQEAFHSSAPNPVSLKQITEKSMISIPSLKTFFAVGFILQEDTIRIYGKHIPNILQRIIPQRGIRRVFR